MTASDAGKPIAVLLGDRNGVGPELVAKSLADPDKLPDAPLLIIGDRRVLDEGATIAGVSLAHLGEIAEPAMLADHRLSFLHRGRDLDPRPMGEVDRAAGLEMLDLIETVSAMALAGRIGGICYAPLNKSALRRAGHAAGDELELFARKLPAPNGYGEINVLDGLFTSRVTSHIPLAEVAGQITVDSVLRGAGLLQDALVAAGRERPRLALSALNPHAGEGGAYGSEEIEVLAPAVAAAQERGIDLSGPFPSDTVFPRAIAERMDGVVTLFHDQGQIALKMIGLGKGVTLLTGFPVPVTTPGHGTAFDIAGKGVADHTGFVSALGLAAAMRRPA